MPIRILHKRTLNPVTLTKVNLFIVEAKGFLGVFVGSGHYNNFKEHVFDFFCDPGVNDDEPCSFDPNRRTQLRTELDAYCAKLYGLTRDELRYILDPSDTHGEDYPSVTFPTLKKNDTARYGHYRTQHLVLEAWDKLNETRTVSV